MRVIRIFFLFVSLISFLSCVDKKPHFIIEGNISEADEAVLYLEKRELNNFTTIDSVLLNSDGKFEFKASALPYPEFYVLKLNKQIINLAIDSTETITINASANNFATDYTIDNSPTNEQIKKLILAKYKADKTLGELQNQFDQKQITDQQYALAIDTLSNEYKTMASKIILEDLKSPAAYFALFQKFGSYLFFDPYIKSDAKIFAAVANAWDFYYPLSPRSEQLKKFALEAMKIRKQNEVTPISLDTETVASQEYLNIELPDINNRDVSLKLLKGKPIVLDFIVYQSEISPQHNMKLNALYNKYKGNIEIYQVSFDADKHLWQNAATNIPWIAVYDNQSLNSPLLTKYNIQSLPTIYLLDKEGELQKRVDNIDALEADISKLL